MKQRILAAILTLFLCAQLEPCVLAKDDDSAKVNSSSSPKINSSSESQVPSSKGDVPTSEPTSLLTEPISSSIPENDDKKNDIEPSEETFSMLSERPAYDANIDYIRLFLTNKTDISGEFSESYTFEKLTGGEWTTVPTNRGQPISFNEIAWVLPPDITRISTVNLSAYKKPLPPGRYRITKPLIQGGEPLSSEFYVISPESCLEISRPSAVKVMYKEPTRTGTILLNIDESFEYVNVIWHELLAFQKGARPKDLLSTGASIDLSLQMLDRSLVNVSLHETETRTYALVNDEWYFVNDIQVFDRIASKVIELGGFLPGTGDELIQALNGLPTLKDVKFSVRRFSTPFAFQGWQSDAKSEASISIFQFPSAYELNEQMRYVYDDGYSIGFATAENGVNSFKTKKYAWPQPPHYFKAGSRLVLYNGIDKDILADLTGLLGEKVIASK